MPATQPTLLVDQVRLGSVLIGDAMGIEDPPRNRSHLGVLLAAANKVEPQEAPSLPRDEQFFTLLSSALEEATLFRGHNSADQDTNDLHSLLKTNARLRTLAVKLSNLLGDLPPLETPTRPPE